MILATVGIGVLLWKGTSPDPDSLPTAPKGTR
jgi:hypothetical protein